MTRYEPIRSGRRKDDGKRSPSLVERASEAYDFSAALRGELGPELKLPEAILGSEPMLVPASAPSKPEVEASERVDIGFEPAVAPELMERVVDPQSMPVPQSGGQVQSIDRDKLVEGGYLIPDGPVTGISEEFRIVKRQLLRTAAGQDGSAVRHGERILVCSAHPGEGKTFCTVNLALSMAAEKDIDVLLVDADFAKPNILAALGLSGGEGLMDALTNPAIAVEDCVIRTDLPNLSVLPAGRRANNDSEYLASARTQKVLDALTLGRPGRMLLFDSPPILAASPASVLATHVGQALMVVRADKTSESALRDALGLMQGCDNVRLLLNGVKFSASGRRFGAYYGQGD
jgi:protein-tyrosine kinase